MKKFINDLITEADNLTPDIFRLLAIVSVVSGVALQVFGVVAHHDTFNMQTFGEGIGYMFGGLGVLFGFKKEAPTS